MMMTINYNLNFVAFFSLGLCAYFVKSTTVFVHRGASLDFPENTVSAFKEAFKFKCSIEFDVRETKDHHFVVIHDDNVNRTSNGKGSVDNLSLKEMKSLDAGSWKNPMFNSTHYPTLLEVIETVKQFKIVPIMIEIKKVENCDEVLDFIEAHMTREDYLLFTKHECGPEINHRMPTRLISNGPTCKNSSITLQDCLLAHRKSNTGQNVLKINASKARADYINIANTLGFDILLNLAGVVRDSDLFQKVLPLGKLVTYVAIDFPYQF